MPASKPAFRHPSSRPFSIVRFAIPSLAAPSCAFVASILTGCSGFPPMSEAAREIETRDLALQSYDEGTRFAEAGNLELALERFQRAEALGPRPRVLFETGRTLEQLGRPEEALLRYARALKLAPDYQEARLALEQKNLPPPDEATILASPEVFDEYLAEVERAVEVAVAEAGPSEGPDDAAEALARRREIAAEERLPTAAEVRAALFPGAPGGADVPSAVVPGSALARETILDTYRYHYENGRRYQRGQEYEKAAAEYRLALQADPSRMDARLDLGDCMLRLERWPQAEFHYRTALEEFPDSPRPAFKMGNYHEALRRPDLAREFYRKSLAIDPAHVEALNNLAALEIRDRNHAGAITLLEKAIAADPSYELAWLNLGVSRENSGDRGGALEAYRRYVQLEGEQADQVRVWIQELEP